jgi:hypothetical protein
MPIPENNCFKIPLPDESLRFEHGGYRWQWRFPNTPSNRAHLITSGLWNARELNACMAAIHTAHYQFSIRLPLEIGG